MLVAPGRLRSLSVAVFTLLVGLTAAQAEIPNPTCIDVTPWDAMEGALLSPPGDIPVPGSTAHLIIRNSDCRPMANASVVVLLGAANVLCGSTILNGTTEEDGSVDFTLEGGGCAHEHPSACVIKVNGVTVRSYNNAKSPDYDGGGGNLAVDISDLIVFANEFTDQAANACHDYDNDGNTGLSDLISFSAAFASAAHCD